MEIQKEEQTTYYITMDKHDFACTKQMLQAWYDKTLPQLETTRPTVIEFGILDAFEVKH